MHPPVQSAPIPEQAEPEQPCARTRDSEFWYGDGNIILVARDVEFRVYRGILADHSPVFDDMFSLPQSTPSTPHLETSTGSTTDVSPLVHLTDSPEDLRHLLRVCMPKKGMFNPFTLNTPSYHMVSALIRLGHKYQMSGLVADAVGYLKQWYAPKHLGAWAGEFLYGPHAPFQRVHAIGIVNLARIVDEPEILPAALLVCCSLKQEIVEGFVREDGTREMLPLDDIGRCFAVRALLAQQGFTLVLDLFTPAIPWAGCTTPVQCEKELQKRQVEAMRYLSSAWHSDVFVHAAHILESAMDCSSCQKMLRERYARFGPRLWYQLPYLF